MTITKALLPSDVAYEGGYQDAPVSNWTDVPVQVKGYLDELGVHAQACSNEASAAAMLLEATAFLSFDDRQRKAATAEGIGVFP
jgi:TPP-dependent indolepyruvate ferredoxin oxidoreductase alpha subunit